MVYPYDDIENDELGLDMYGEKQVNDQLAQDNASLEDEFNKMPVEPVTPVQAPPQAAPPAPQTMPSDKYANLMDEYARLQNERAGKFRNLAIVDALSQVGQAIAGKNAPGFKPRSSMDLYEKMINQPVEDYSNRIKQRGLDIQLQDILKERDPNSPVAKQARKLATDKGYEVTEEMSPKDIENLSKYGEPLKTIGEKQGIVSSSQKLKTGKISLQDAEQMRDPTSSISDFYRNAAIKRGFKPEEVKDKSAWDISNMAKILPKPASGTRNFQTKYVTDPNTGEVKVMLFDTSTGQMVNMGQTAGFAPKAIENKRTGETQVFTPGLGKVTADVSKPSPQQPEQAQQQVPEVTRENLNVNQQKRLDDTRKAFLDDTKDDRNSLQASKGIQNLLATGQKLNGDILRLIQNKFARASGERGAMTEQDVAPYGGRQEIVAKIERNMKNWSEGKINDTDRQFLSNIATAMQRQTERDLGQRTEFFSNNLYNDLKSSPNFKDIKMTPQSIKALIGSEVYTDPNFNKIAVIEKKTGKKGYIPKERIQDALQSGQYELVK